MRSGGLQFALDVGFCLGAETLLRRGVHLAKGAIVPRATVGNLQNQRFGFTGWAEYGFDVGDGLHGGILPLMAGYGKFRFHKAAL